MSNDKLKIQDPSILTAEGWLEVEKLQNAYRLHGLDAVNDALDELKERDIALYSMIVCAFFPSEFLEAVREQMAEQGLHDDNLQEVIQTLEGSVPRIH